jgi:ubiquitin carboxyl-terminal hydrolase 4/11/15
MSDNDVIVCFELPCNARQSRSYKKKSNDPAILPVYFCGIKVTRNTFRTPTLFGYPIVIVIDEDQARSVEVMYEAVVMRLERWTEMARDLYVWEVGQSSDTESALRVKINGYAPMEESITEIREDGKVVTLESTSSLDGDIADEKGMLVDEDRELHCVGVKKDLFTLRLHVNHRDYGTSFNGYSSAGQWISWEDRLQEADTHPNLLRDNDAFFCEFDEDKKTYYFGDGLRPEHARWDHWDVFTHPELEEAKRAAAEKSHKGITLQDCLEEFTKQEKLGEDDLWYCPRCKKHQQATKKFDLWKAPDILVVHLKRFSNNRIFRDKIDTHIDFPIEGLDLSDVVKERAAARKLLERGVDIESLGLNKLDEPLIYDLYAVDEHLGGLGGGHYRAYAANHMNGRWYHFDDSFVSPAHASDSVVSCSFKFDDNGIERDFTECQCISSFLPSSNEFSARPPVVSGKVGNQPSPSSGPGYRTYPRHFH